MADGFQNFYPGGARESVKIPKLLSLAEFMATYKTPDYIVEGILQRGRLYALTSPTGHGKTAVTQCIGIHVGAGRNLGNIEVVRAPVIFLAGENPDDLCVRMYAACQVNGIDPTEISMHVMAGNFPLSEEAAQELKDQIDEKGIQPGLIIFDTAASFFPGDDPNANGQMGNYARNLRVLTTCKGNPAVLVPAHPVKNPDRENLIPYGGGAFLNELDGNLTLWAEVMGENATMYWQGKFRGSDFQPVAFKLQQVRIAKLLDRKKQPVMSIIAALQTAGDAEAAAKSATGDENTVLELLRRHPGITQRDLATTAGWVNDKGIPNQAKVNRLLKALQKDKLGNSNGVWSNAIELPQSVLNSVLELVSEQLEYVADPRNSRP